MCLIVHRPVGIKTPSDWFDNALANNPDGWGIVASTGRALSIARGLDPKKFHTALKTFKDKEVLIHFRFATHGSVSVENCHPFTICDGGFAVVHNGVINIDTSSNEDLSDSWHYANGVLAPMLQENPRLIESNSFLVSTGKAIGSGNKIVLIRADGKIGIINPSFGFNLANHWLSNTCSIEPRRVFIPSRSQAHSWKGWDNTSCSYGQSDDQEDWDLEDIADMELDEIIDFMSLVPDDVALAIKRYVELHCDDWR
jgi:hypothetical protein